jgi:DNA-binding MarR family transcriptional regulator
MDRLLKDQFLKAVLSSKRMLMLFSAKSGVPFAEIAILMHIHHLTTEDVDNDGVCVTGIKDQTHISLPAVSRQLSSLEQKGLIERKTMPKDRRITLVSLTAAGEDVLKKIIEQRDLQMDKLGVEVGEEYIRKYVEMASTILNCLENSAKAE